MEKKFELMKDRNGRTMRTGDIVKIENAYFKSDNGYYFIAYSPGDVSWSGSSYSLHKIGKRGKISTAKYNLASWPLCSYCSDQRKNWAADEHNKDNATIEIVDCIDNTEVIAHFKEEAEKSMEQAHYYEVRGCDWEKWAKVYSDTADHYKEVVKRISSGNITEELTAEPETPAEPTQKPQEKPETIVDDTDTTAEEKEPGKATEDARKGKKEMIYKYGMRLRGFSIGCQPAGVVERSDDTTGKYWDIITYNRPLTGEGMRTYSLDDLNDNKINRILTEYAAQYERLYNSNNSKLEQSASAQFDAYAKENEDFISEICNVKGDFISSDREAAALMIALVKLGYAKTKRLDTSREEKTTETAPEATETTATDEAVEIHTEDAETAGNGTGEPQKGLDAGIIACAVVKDKTAEENNLEFDYKLILYKNQKEGFYGFGLPQDAKSFYGFPVNQCGDIEEVKESLGRWITGDYTSKSEKEACRMFLEILGNEPMEKHSKSQEKSEGEITATPSPVSKSDTEETPEENSGTPSGDEKSYATKTAVKYYEISEETARRAHEMMSFRDYKKNSATDEYRASVDRAAEVADEQKGKVSPYYHAKIDALLDRYARKLAEWTNAYNRNRASCPSVMICGPANFPTKKKERQNSREDTLWKEYKDIKGIIGKIKSVGTGAIDLADPHARELLQERLDSLKGQLELDKKLNAYWKKHKTFIGCPDISADFAEKLTKEIADMMERCAWMSKPFPDYELASIRDKIKRTQARLDQLNTMQEKANDEDGNTETFDGGEIFRNYEQNRLQIIFNEKPDEETRSKLKSNGFRWSPRNSAWQRQLTQNAEYALKRLELAPAQ